MTAIQPRTPEEAALLGLVRPNIPRGMFGNARRRTQMGFGFDPEGLYLPDDAEGANFSGTPQAVLGANLGATLASQSAKMPAGGQPQPPQPSRSAGRGLFGGVFGRGMPPQSMSPELNSPSMQADKTTNPSMQGDLAKAQGSKGIDWRMVAGIVGDALSGMVGQPPLYAQSMARMRQTQAEHQNRMAQMREEARLRMSQPDYATINNRRVRIDPMTGQSQVLYRAPQEFEDYAATLGAEPGTPEYDRLVQDYVLRGSGPTATDNYNLREEWRQDNRLELEGERQGNREALLGQRQAGQRALKATPTYRQANPTPPRAGGRSTGRAGGVREGQTATNPQTGAKVVYRGGKWIPVR